MFKLTLACNITSQKLTYNSPKTETAEKKNFKKMLERKGGSKTGIWALLLSSGNAVCHSELKSRKPNYVVENVDKIEFEWKMGVWIKDMIAPCWKRPSHVKVHLSRSYCISHVSNKKLTQIMNSHIQMWELALTSKRGEVTCSLFIANSHNLTST